MKKSFIYVALFVVMAGGAIFQNAGAQNIYGFDCAKDYETGKLGCLRDLKTCDIECDKAYPFDPAGAATRCKSICDSDRTSCDALVDDWYRECLGLETSGPKSDAIPPDVAPPVPDQTAQEKSVSDDNQMVQTESVDTVRFESSVREEAKNIIEMKKCPASSLPSENSCVAEKLDFIIAKARESFLTISFFDKRENARPVIVEPVAIDTQGDIEFVGFSNMSFTNGTLDVGNFQQFTSIYLPSPLEAEDSTEWRVYSQGSIDVKSGESGVWESTQFKSDVAQDTIIVTDTDRAVLASPGNSSVIEIEPASIVEIEPMKTPEVKESVTATVYSGIVKIEDGESEDIFIQTPLTTTTSKHTKFVVLYNPEKLYAATIVYEGEVEVTDVFSGNTMVLAPRDDGKPRMVVVPLESAVGVTEKFLNGNLIWVLIPAIFLGGGYVLYRKGAQKTLFR